MQTPRFGIPGCEREHPDETPNGCLDTPPLERRQHDFGVRMTSKADAVLAQLASELTGVEHLAIEYHRKAATGGRHRLMAGWRKIDNRESAESETDPGRRIGSDSGIIRSAM